MAKLFKLITKNILYIAFLQAFVAMLSSLYFSNIANLPPCVLCWYQRICMYPLAAILAVGIWRKDTKVYLYVLPLSIVGFFISAYHNLLYYGFLPESITPCTQGVSCTLKLIEWFGFVTIPLLSFIGFAVINLCMLIYIKSQK